MDFLDWHAWATIATAVGVCQEHAPIANRVVLGGPLLEGPGQVTARTASCTACAVGQAA